MSKSKWSWSPTVRAVREERVLRLEEQIAAEALAVSGTSDTSGANGEQRWKRRTLAMFLDVYPVALPSLRLFLTLGYFDENVCLEDYARSIERLIP